MIRPSLTPYQAELIQAQKERRERMNKAQPTVLTRRPLTMTVIVPRDPPWAVGKFYSDAHELSDFIVAGISIPTTQELTLKKIIRAVCLAYRVPRLALLRDNRATQIMRARHIGYWLCKRLTPHSLPAIGRAFSRDHTSILHGVRKVEALLETDAGLADEIDGLLAVLSPGVERREFRGRKESAVVAGTSGEEAFA